MRELARDFRFVVRSLSKRPAFTAVVVLTLALGIGANTAVFTVVSAVLLRPLPYPNPERLVYVWETSQADPTAEDSLSPHNYTDFHNRNRSFESYFAYEYESFSLTGDDQPEALLGVKASSDFGATVGMPAAMGRIFSAEDDVPGKDRVALISDGLWKRRFGASPEAVGKTIQLNGEPYTIIGVMSPLFRFPSSATDLWVPLALDLSKYQRGTAFLGTAARLKPGTTLGQARADLQGVVEQLRQEIPGFSEDFGAKVEPVREHLLGDIERPLLILFGAVVFVLLIACVNVANLVLGRATARWREIALRSALGASRGRLIRLLITESLVLAVAGGGLGLLLATYGVEALTAINPDAIPNREPIAIDGFVIAFTFLMSMVTGVLFGLAPAWQATRTDLNTALRESSRSATGTKRLNLIRSFLVVAEVSLSLVLLVGAGLLVKSLWNLMQVNPGFQPENVVTCSVNLARVKYPEDWKQADFFRRTLERVRAIPGVQSAGFGTSLPFSGSRATSSFSIDGREAGPNNGPFADRPQVAPGYFAAMGIPLIQGRDFSDADDISRPGVIIINKAAAALYWPNENPIGRRLTIGMPQEVKLYGKPVSREIIGVAGNVKHEELKDDFHPEIYIPAWQLPSLGMTLVVRGDASPESLIKSMREAVQAVDREQPIRRPQLLTAAVARSMAPQRFVTMLLLLFAGLALLLAVVGIYGVMSYSVAQRTHEIGIRIALGAQAADVLGLVVGRGLVLTLSGVAVGAVAAFALTHLLSKLLYGVGESDPVTFTIISLLLTMVALLACWIPARRAAKVDPMVALRCE